jgi:hypothetical protein
MPRNAFLIDEPTNVVDPEQNRGKTSDHDTPDAVVPRIDTKASSEPFDGSTWADRYDARDRWDRT